MHIGSQITDLDPFRNAFTLLEGAGRRASRAQGFAIDFVNLGGGLGVPYRSDSAAPPVPDQYARLVERRSAISACKLLFEPGRMIAANAGILVVARALGEGRGAAKTFTIVDAAMNDLLRPTLYDAYHEIWPVSGTGARRADHRHRRGRSGLRDRRLSRPVADGCRSYMPAISLP